MGLNFSGCHFPQEIIMQALRYYLAYKLSYREIEEIFAERNIRFDHSTLNRWVIKYAPLLEANFRTRKRKVADSWQMDETYIKIKGKSVCYYRAVDKHGSIRSMMRLTVVGWNDKPRAVLTPALFSASAMYCSGRPMSGVIITSMHCANWSAFCPRTLFFLW